MKTPLCLATVAALVLVAPALYAVEKEKPKVLPAAEARKHIDETGTYELVVQLTKNVPDKVCYLDSEKDYKDEKNLALLIDHDNLDVFKKAGIDDPATYYKGKTIRVTGKVIHESEQTRIHVTNPSQIEVVATAKPS